MASGGNDMRGHGEQGVDVAPGGRGMDMVPAGKRMDMVSCRKRIEMILDREGMDIASGGKGINISSGGKGIDMTSDGKGMDIASDRKGIDVASGGTRMKKNRKYSGRRGNIPGVVVLAAVIMGLILMVLLSVLLMCQDGDQRQGLKSAKKNTTPMSEKIDHKEVTSMSKNGEGEKRAEASKASEDKESFGDVLKKQTMGMIEKINILEKKGTMEPANKIEPADKIELTDTIEPAGAIKKPDTIEIRQPGSDFFRQVAGNIWGKDCKFITAEEYASLTSLQIDTSEKTVAFQLDHGAVQTMSYGQESGMDTADLAAFPGLEWISIDRKLQPGDLQGLEGLFGVYTRNNLKEMADVIPNLDKITELGVADDTGEKTLDGIEAFSNLTYFSADYRALEDISALLNFSELQGLMLEGCDFLEDYSPLESLINLEWLKLASRRLETIDFISSMGKLTSLAIEGSWISDVAGLEACTGLTFLSLTGNSLIQDYSVIGKLAALEELTLELGHGGKLPSFEKLVHLERLSLKDVDDLSPLKEARCVISLFLDHCSGAQLEEVSAMSELDTLEIHRFFSPVDSLDCLTKLSKLTTLHLQNVKVKGNIEKIFGIPSLKSLHLDNCKVGLDFSSLPVNENLEILSINGISIVNNPGGIDGTGERAGDGEIKLSEHYEFFDCFPNLTELYLESLGLEDVAFAEKLPHLQHLDILDNPVTNLKELRNLEEIRTVWYGGGTILFP